MSEARLRFVGDEGATQQLEELIQKVGTGTASGSIQSLPYRRESGEPGIAYVIALGPESSRAGQGGRVHTAVLLCSPSQNRAPVDAWFGLFGLTDWGRAIFRK